MNYMSLSLVTECHRVPDSNKHSLAVSSDVCLKTLNETIQFEMNKITVWLNVNK